MQTAASVTSPVIERAAPRAGDEAARAGDLVARTSGGSFGQRYRAMRSRWNAEWWSIAFGGPVANVLGALVADVRWITPNRVTLLSFAAKVAAVPLVLAASWRADLAVVLLFQVHTVLDCLDGSLARYRRQPSAMGAYLDKATDMAGLVAIMAALGWRAATTSGDLVALLVALLIAAGTLLRFYLYWVVLALEREAKVPAPTVGDRRIDCSRLDLGQRAALYLRSMVKIAQVSEADLYFWFALALLLGQLRWMIYAVGCAQAVWLVLVVARRTAAVAAIDRRARVRAAVGGAS